MVETDNRYKLMFNILRVIEQGYTYEQLIKLNYDPKLVDFIFRFRKYILICKKNRG